MTNDDRETTATTNANIYPKLLVQKTLLHNPFSYLAKGHFVRLSRVCRHGRLDPHYSGSQNQVGKLENWCCFYDIHP